MTDTVSSEWHFYFEARLKRDCVWAEKGHVVASEQFPLNNAARVPSKSFKGIIAENAPALDGMVDNGKILRLRSDNAEISFDTTTGRLVGLVCNGVEHLHLCQGPSFNWYRTINNTPRNWENTDISLKDFRWELSDDRRTATVFAELEACVGGKDVVPHTVTYTVHGDGKVDVDAAFKTSSKFNLPRLGLQMSVAPGFENLTWFGRGPIENYTDRKNAAYVGLYNAPVDSLAEHYVRAQSMGSRQDTRWLTLTDSNGRGIKVTADGSLGFSALHFADQDLWEAKYGHNLPSIRREEVILTLDCASEGLGNASCGPGPMEQYRLVPGNDYSYAFRIEPLTR